MTNADYIKSKMSDADIALMIMPYARFDDKKTSLIEKAYEAWENGQNQLLTIKGIWRKADMEIQLSRKIHQFGIGCCGIIPMGQYEDLEEHISCLYKCG